MRYVIEIPEKAEAKLKIFLQEQKNAKLVDRYDPIIQLEERVEKIGTLLREFRKTGATWDVFRTFLHGKGLGYTQIDEVLLTAEEFMKKVGLKP